MGLQCLNANRCHMHCVRGAGAIRIVALLKQFETIRLCAVDG